MQPNPPQAPLQPPPAPGEYPLPPSPTHQPAYSYSSQSVLSQYQDTSPAPSSLPNPNPAPPQTTYTPPPNFPPVATPAPIPEYQAVAPASITPQSQSKRLRWGWFRKSHGNVTKTTSAVFRDVLVNLLGAGAVAAIGWLIYSWVGLFGIHYSDAKTPWITAREDYRSSRTAFITMHLKAPSAYSNITTVDVDDLSKKASEKIETYEKSSHALEDQKALTAGDLKDDYQAYKEKSAQYISFSKDYVASYKIVQSAIASCGAMDLSMADTDLVKKVDACQSTLTAVRPDSIPNSSFKTLLTEYRDVMSTSKSITDSLQATPQNSAKRFDVISQWTTNETKKNNVIFKANTEVNKSLENVSLSQSMDKIDSRLSQLIEKEK